MAADLGGAGLEESLLRDLQPPRAQKSGRIIALAEAAARTLRPAERGARAPWTQPCTLSFVSACWELASWDWCGAGPASTWALRAVRLSILGSAFQRLFLSFCCIMFVFIVFPPPPPLLPKTMNPGVCGLWESEWQGTNVKIGRMDESGWRKPWPVTLHCSKAQLSKQMPPRTTGWTLFCWT